jgi:flagellar basal-body rod protein FlgF
MDSGFYAALTGLIARMDALELLANNLANVSTTGYKAQHEFYRALAALQANVALNPINRAANDYSVLGGATLDLRPGSIQPTANDLDIALEGSGFIVVKTKNGLRYTRNGSLHLSPEGILMSSQNDPVLSEPETPKDMQTPIQVPSGKIAIGPDGTVSVNGALVAKMRLVDFANPALLTLEGETYYVAAKGVVARPASNPRVRQGALESSNFDPVAGTVDLMVLQRHAQLLQHALFTFHNDFNQAAAQTLPAVS